MATTTLPLGDVRDHLSEVVARVHDTHERVTITRNGRPTVVMVAVEDLEALNETLEILSDPDQMRRLAEADAELARGEYVTPDEMDAALQARSRREQAEHG